MNNLPIFEQPPITEAYYSFAFEAPPEIQTLELSEFRNMMIEDYPLLEEHAPVQLQFELFTPPVQGGRNALFPMPTFPISGSRFWFVSKDEKYIVQIQKNLLIINWRNLQEKENIYPGHVEMRGRLIKALSALQDFLNKKYKKDLKITQCEAFFSNNITDTEMVDIGRYFSCVDVNLIECESANFSFKKKLIDSHGNACGRLSCDAVFSLVPNPGESVLLNFRTRGKPEDGSFEGALAFADRMHDVIVETFVQVTSEHAHQVWGRYSR